MALVWTENTTDTLPADTLPLAGNGLLVTFDGLSTNAYVSADGGTTYDTNPIPAPASGTWVRWYFAGDYFFIFSDDGESYIRSPDCLTWTAFTLPTPVFGAPNGLTHAAGIYILMADSADSFVLRSPDGENWTTAAIVGDTYRDVTYGNGIVLAVAFSGGYARSLDLGLTWDYGTIGFTGYTQVGFANAHFLCFRANTTVRRTADGATFVSETLPFTPDFFLAYGGNSQGFVISNSGGDSVAYKDIDDTWIADTTSMTTGNNYGLAANEEFVYIGRESGNLWFSEIPVPTAQLLDGVAFGSPILLMQFGTVVDSVALGQLIDLTPGAIARARALFNGAPLGVFEGTVAVEEELIFQAHATFVVRLLLSEGLVLGSPVVPSYTVIARIVSRLLLTGSARNFAEALAQIADGLVFAAVADALSRGQLRDTVVLNGAVTALYELTKQLLERAVFNAQATPHYTLTALIEERLLLSASLQHQADITVLLRESVGFALSLSFDNGEFIAWVMNTQGQKPHTTYANYPFNSFAKIGNKYFGAASTGIFELEGEDDDGEDIDAYVRLGLSAMGTRKLKRIPDAFIGYTSDGTLLIKVITISDPGGEKQAAIYRLAVRAASNTVPNRFKLGRGLVSVDWDFEIHNVDGAEFDLQSIQFRPLILDRRTRG